MSTRHRKPSTVRRVLTTALTAIERPYGWCKGASHRDTASGITAVCASAALSDVEARRPYLKRQARNLLSSVMGGDIISYNDATGRTKAEVVAKYREAIAKA